MAGASSKALPLKFCDDLIQYGLSKNDKLALTGEFEKETLSNKEVKNLKKKFTVWRLEKVLTKILILTSLKQS